MRPRSTAFAIAVGLALAAPGVWAAGGARPAISIARLEPALVTGEAKARLALSPDLAPTWREANVGLLALRSAGRQQRLDASAAGAELEVALPHSGCALLIADLGRPATRGYPDSWRRTERGVKAVLCRDSGDPVADLAARRRAASLLMARAGTRDEVRPLANPATTKPGSVLPVRIYAGGREAPGVEVLAEGPGGLARTVVTDAQGFAVVALPVAGTWRVRVGTGGERAAELHFDVPPASLHEAVR